MSQQGELVGIYDEGLTLVFSNYVENDTSDD